MPREYDFIVIGGGSAGFNAARVSASYGKRVLVVDGAKELGGLCILRGCMPSKTLIYMAEVLHTAKRGRLFGMVIPNARADMKRIHERKKRIIKMFSDDRESVLRNGKFELVQANASFVDPHTIKLSNGKTVRGKCFLIGTGSRASVPPIPGLREARFWTSDDVLELDFLPKSVVVLGGGIVACELAQFLNRVGSKVTVLQRGRNLLSHQSPESAKVVQQALQDEGVNVVTEAAVQAIRQTTESTTVVFSHGGRKRTITAANLFNALGREPNTSSLNLEAAGVRTLESGRIDTNRWQQTSAPNIYAAGDCCGPHEIVHVAIQQGELAARHAAGRRHIKPVDYSRLLNVVFTDPQLASIGMSTDQLDKKKVRYLTASYPFNDHGKSILMEANYGFVRVSADSKTGRILGAQIVGKDAGELIHCFTGPMAMGATVFDMLKASWYHPTLSEIVTYPLEEIAEKIDPRQVNP
jgi:pyruvate/2-oxoglutarate dehydrogenase complex dihydrolipoamide dehydrogenase (E3) component